MKIRPILFSTLMVEAILEGNKTQTRRTIKPQPNFDSAWENHGTKELPNIDISNSLLGLSLNDGGIGCCTPNVKVKAHKGDIFWVRETFQLTHWEHPSSENYGYIYKASENGREWESNDDEWTWKPSIFMPKEACRIFLKVTNVRVERVQDISEHDIYDEGVKILRYLVLGGKNEPINFLPNGYLGEDYIGEESKIFAMAHWASLWSKINGIDSWNENPFVWVYDFETVEKPNSF